MIDVKIEHRKAQHLLALPHRGDYLKIGETFDMVFEKAAAAGLTFPEAESIGVYYDDPEVVPSSELRASAGITMASQDVKSPEGFELLELPDGDYAIGVHRGPYEELLNSYRWLFGQWLPSSGREAANQPCHEIYVTDPATTAPAELITHICIPLVSGVTA